MKKGFAIATAAFMMLAVFAVMSAPSASAADVTVALKKPMDGSKWYMGQSYTVSWTYPTGAPSDVISIEVRIPDALMNSIYYWSAADNPGVPAPTSCLVYVPIAADSYSPGAWNVVIQVEYLAQPGVYELASDSHRVTIADGILPTIYDYPVTPQRVVLGAAGWTTASYYDYESYVSVSGVRVTVDGRPAPSGEWFATGAGWGPGIMQLDTDWLSLGKHRVTVTVTDNSGNLARASWVVQVVRA